MIPENKYSSVPHCTQSACAHFCTASVMIFARAILDTRSAFASQKRASALKARIVIIDHQWQSFEISGHQGPSVAISGHQRPSGAIGGHQWHSTHLKARIVCLPLSASA